MTDPRDDFEIIYATRHLQGNVEPMQSLRSDNGGYEFDQHIQDCFYHYLMGISKGSKAK